MTRQALALAAAAALLAACAKVPYTGRKAVNIIPEKLMVQLGKASYTDTLQGETVKKKGADVDVLNKVGRRISKVAKRPDFAWEYNLIEDDVANAWCLPGGYIGFYTGILPVLEHEAGMAFVMGHEVGHATARHGTERLSQQLGVLGGMAGLYLFLDKKTSLNTEQKAILTGALGVGAQVGVVLPFSRKHESEADIIGTMYMAEAGYPPGEATKLWDRMDALGSSGIPAFLSTHPSNDKRKAVIRDWLPQARKKYERNKLPGDVTSKLW